MQELRPTVWIGRQGVTEKVVREVAVQLKKRHRIKVKWLRNVDADPEDLARQADATVLEVRGRTAVLAEQKTG
jgi:RNA-binding protein